MLPFLVDEKFFAHDAGPGFNRDKINSRDMSTYIHLQFYSIDIEQMRNNHSMQVIDQDFINYFLTVHLDCNCF